MLRKPLFIALGWLCVLLGVIGAVLPLLPTTPFLILALLLFSKSSPAFHQMLLNNRLFGPGLRQWEANRSLARPVKRKASVFIVLTFSISIYLVAHNAWLQMMLVTLMGALLVFIWRLKES